MPQGLDECVAVQGAILADAALQLEQLPPQHAPAGAQAEAGLAGSAAKQRCRSRQRRLQSSTPDCQLGLMRNHMFLCRQQLVFLWNAV